MTLHPIQLSGIACRHLRTPKHILDNVYIEFDGPRISIMGDFNSASLPPGVFNAREEELTVVSGLVDVHVHGAGGIDFLHADQEGAAINLEGGRAGRRDHHGGHHHPGR